jgi:hypothetical protein
VSVIVIVGQICDDQPLELQRVHRALAFVHDFAIRPNQQSVGTAAFTGIERWSCG